MGSQLKKLKLKVKFQMLHKEMRRALVGVILRQV